MKGRVRGPADVKPNDLVEFPDRDNFRPKHYTAHVVKATPARLTVRVLGETATRSMAYTYTDRSAGFRGEIGTYHRFMRLGAWDRWQRERPVSACFRHEVGGTIATSPGIVRGSLDEAIDELRAINAWLLREPDKDAP